MNDCENIKKNLSEISINLIEISKFNIKILDNIEKITNSIPIVENSTNDIKKIEDESEPESLETDNKLTSLNEFDQIDPVLLRRIELHKSLGTYVKPESESESEEKTLKTNESEPLNETNVLYPTTSPLLKLNNDQRNKLLYNIYKQSKINVEKYLINDSCLNINEKINTESDRLLDIWIKDNK